MRLESSTQAENDKFWEALMWVFWQGAYSSAMLSIYWLLHKVFGLKDKQLDWAFYLLLCASLPIVYLLIPKRNTSPLIAYLSALMCCGSLLWLGLDGFFNKGNAMPIIGGIFIGTIPAWNPTRQGHMPQPKFVLSIICVISAFVLLHFSAKLAWWTDLSSLLRHNRLLIPALFAVAYLFFHYLRPASTTSQSLAPRNSFVLYWLVVIVIFLESFRTFALFQVDEGVMHHWTCYVGPVELIKQGGTLLWDVPSQYGFLNILIASLLPFTSSWDSVYVLAGMTQLVMGWALFHHFCGKRSLENVTSAGILAVVSVFIIPGWKLTGSLVYPSVSALRFLWVVLMFICLYSLATAEGQRRRMHYHVLNLLWLFGVLWAFESAYYCSVTLGSFLVAQYLANVRNSRRFLHELKLLHEPAIMLFFSIFGIWMFYRFRFGHGPDWYGYVEHALAFQSGFGSFPIVLTGGFLYVLAIFALLLRICRVNASAPAGRAVFGMVCGTAAVFSYFVGRSHENNIVNIFPMLLAPVVFGCRLMQRDDTAVLRTVAVSLLSPVVILGVGNKEFFIHLHNTWTHQQHHVAPLVPPLTPKVAYLLSRLEIHAKTSCVLADIQGFTILPRNLPPNIADLVDANLWLPLCPLAVLNPLPPERIRTYFERWQKNHPTSGWLIYSSFDKPFLSPVLDVLEHYFKLERQIQYDDYTARFYTPLTVE